MVFRAGPLLRCHASIPNALISLLPWYFLLNLLIDEAPLIIVCALLVDHLPVSE